MDEHLSNIDRPYADSPPERPSAPRRTPEACVQAGWEALVGGDHGTARAYFLSAVHRAPGWEPARDGLVEALKSRLWLYRAVQKTGLTVGAVVSGRGRLPLWAFILLATGIPGFLIKIARSAPETGPYVWTILLSYLAGITLIQVADYVSTIRAWSDPDAQLVMTRRLVIGSGLALLSTLFVLVAIGMSFAIGHFGGLAAGIVFFGLAYPIEKAGRAPTVSATILAAGFVAAIGVCGMVSVAIMFARCRGVDWNERIPAAAGWFYLAFILGVVASGLVSKLAGAIFPATRNFVDPHTASSDPGRVTLSDEKLRRLHPELYGIRGLLHRWLHPGREVSASEARELTRQHLLLGDSRAAVVISTQPLLVAAFSDDLDCAAVLRFDNWVAVLYGLERGSKLLTVNTYLEDERLPGDLTRGPASSGPWTNFWPVIAEFLSDDIDLITQRKRNIDAAEWKKATAYGQAAIRRSGFRPRDGRPLNSLITSEAR